MIFPSFLPRTMADNASLNLQNRRENLMATDTRGEQILPGIDTASLHRVTESYIGILPKRDYELGEMRDYEARYSYVLQTRYAHTGYFSRRYNGDVA